MTVCECELTPTSGPRRRTPEYEFRLAHTPAADARQKNGIARGKKLIVIIVVGSATTAAARSFQYAAASSPGGFRIRNFFVFSGSRTSGLGAPPQTPLR
jgi:hypothetical protein